MLVQATFEQSRYRSRVIGERFYRRLFKRYPEMRAMFKGDIDDQVNKLMRMIAVLVDKLDQPNEFAETLTNLSIRHQAYGVRPEHYRQAGRVFLWALKPADGKSFSPEVRQAWLAFYETLSAYVVQETSQIVFASG